MKERGILFSAPMILRLLDGTKTATRRIVKPQPEKWHEVARKPFVHPDFPGIWSPLSDHSEDRKCPFAVGMHLWVRETFAAPWGLDYNHPLLGKPAVLYRADDNNTYDSDGKWKPSIFMPRWASRITLEITGVKCERLGEISEADAIAEGCQPSEAYSTWSVFGENGSGSYGDGITNPPVVGADSFVGKILAFKSMKLGDARPAKYYFEQLWRGIHGTYDPAIWVWALTFRIKP